MAGMCVSVSRDVFFSKFFLGALSFFHHLPSGDPWPCKYVSLGAGVGFPPISLHISARVCNQPSTFSRLRASAKKESTYWVKVINLMGSDIYCSVPGNFLLLEQKYILKGRTQLNSTQHTALTCLEKGQWLLSAFKHETAELVSFWTLEKISLRAKQATKFTDLKILWSRVKAHPLSQCMADIIVLAYLIHIGWCVVPAPVKDTRLTV